MTQCLFRTRWVDNLEEGLERSDRRLSAKLVPTFADRECHVVSVTDPYGRMIDCYFFFPVAPQLYSRGPDPDLWICSQELWQLDHRGSLLSST
jgi:hypothetical protein